MDFNKILERFNQTYSFKSDVVENSADLLRMQAVVTAPKIFKNPVLLQIFVRPDGSTHMLFTFDKCEKTLDNYNLVNEFNANSPLFTGYIIDRGNGVDSFELHTANICMTENDVNNYLDYILQGYINSDIVKKYLAPIVELVENNGTAN